MNKRSVQKQTCFLVRILSLSLSQARETWRGRRAAHACLFPAFLSLPSRSFCNFFRAKQFEVMRNFAGLRKPGDTVALSAILSGGGDCQVHALTTQPALGGRQDPGWPRPTRADSRPQNTSRAEIFGWACCLLYTSLAGGAISGNRSKSTLFFFLYIM